MGSRGTSDRPHLGLFEVLLPPRSETLLHVAWSVVTQVNVFTPVILEDSILCPSVCEGWRWGEKREEGKEGGGGGLGGG